jgi:ankyrin repeat protein
MSAEWFMAAEQGDVDFIITHIDGGNPINMRGQHGETALMLAVAGRRTETVEALLRNGADVNVRDEVGKTAMTRAVLHARGLTVVSGRCWPTSKPDRRLTEILAAAGGHFSLREAVILGDVDLARKICDLDCSMEVSGSAHFCFADTYLMLAAQLGPIDMVKFLIDRGADVDATDDLCHTALMRAAEAGHVPIVAHLLDRGANVNWGWPDETALAKAEAHGHLDIAALLLFRGARRTLLDAVDRNDLLLAEELLKEGADPDESRFVDGRMLRHVMYAVSRGSAQMVRLLLDFGASHLIQHWDDHSLLAEAARLGHLEIVRLLMERGADVNAVGTDGRCAQEWLTKEGHAVVMEHFELEALRHSERKREK